MNNSTDDLAARLDRLERANRRWRVASLTLVAALGCLTLVAADNKDAKLRAIDASAIRIWDDSGHLRAVLSSSNSRSAALALISAQGKVCATLGCGKDGSPGLEMSSHNGKVRMRLEAREDGRPMLEFVDNAGHLLSALPHLGVDERSTAKTGGPASEADSR